MVPYRGETVKNGSVELDREVEIGEKNSRSPRYWECMKNHAAGLGAQAFDGCGEFMPGGDPGTLEALKCAACGCHRNFHRKEEIGAAMDYIPYDHVHPVHHPVVLYNAAENSSSKIPPFFRAGLPHMLAYRPLGLASSLSTGSDTPPPAHPLSYSAPEKDRARKRFRTKFTPEQKEEMQKFAEKVGWRIQRHDNDELQEFCTKVGVKRQVLKVWMHNNKSALAGGGAVAPKTEQPSSAISV